MGTASIYAADFASFEQNRSALPKSRIESANDNNAAPDAEGPPESDAPPPTGDDTPRSLADLEDIPF